MVVLLHVGLNHFTNCGRLAVYIYVYVPVQRATSFFLLLQISGRKHPILLDLSRFVTTCGILTGLLAQKDARLRFLLALGGFRRIHVDFGAE